MLRGYAISLGATAMFVVVVRGVLWGQHVTAVVQEAIVVLVLFTLFGALAGYIADYLLRDCLESAFRSRVQWYRDGINAAEQEEKRSINDP